ncbi:hypothetical protein CTI14_01790 [Methylobacterium radiotolerans]|nr:hypothetical protein CTI14_01790 [Methylobacterium radiotolerans]
MSLSQTLRSQIKKEVIMQKYNVLDHIGPQGFLTVPEIAEILRVSPTTIRAAIHSGALRAFKFSAYHFRVYRPDFEGYIISCTFAK